VNLLPGETAIAENQIPSLALTTHRVRYTHEATGATRIVSITLDAVSSCGILSKNYPILLILAAIAALLGVLSVAMNVGEGKFRTGAFLLAIGLAIAYFLLRKVVLAISSAGESITVSAAGQKPDAMIGFIESVEQAKLAYLGKASTVVRQGPPAGG